MKRAALVGLVAVSTVAFAACAAFGTGDSPSASSDGGDEDRSPGGDGAVTTPDGGDGGADSGQGSDAAGDLGTVRCGDVACQLPDEVCCANSQGPQGCVSSGGPCNGAKLACDSPANCAAGNVCCFGLSGAACHESCGSGTIERCDLTSPHCAGCAAYHCSPDGSEPRFRLEVCTEPPEGAGYVCIADES
jgi:hypothetical protein